VNGSSQPTTLIFGAKARFLPVHATTLRGPNDISSDQSLEYQLVAARDALILKSAKKQITAPKALGPKLKFFAFNGSNIYTVDSYELLTDEAAFNRRTTSTAAWTIQDMTNPPPRNRAVRLETASSTPTRHWFLMANGLLVLVLLGIWGVRRARSRHAT
jgi:hypothetical protein